MAYVFVMGDVKVTAPITVEDSTKKTLRWIGCTIEENSKSFYDDSIDSFSDIIILTEIYILTIYQLTFTEGLRLMGRYTLVCAEQK